MPDSLTLAEAVLSRLIATGQMDETNTSLLRDYETAARRLLDISSADFYTEIYDHNDETEFGELDNHLEKLFL